MVLNVQSTQRIGSLVDNTASFLYYTFNGSTTYAISNSTVVKTANNGTVSGGVTVVDGAINLSGIANVALGNIANFNEGLSFSFGCKFKFSSFPTSPVSGIFGSYFDCGPRVSSSGVLDYALRGSSIVAGTYGSISLDTRYTFYMVYDHTETKFYVYVNGVLFNSGGTTGPTTFNTDNRGIGYNYIYGGTAGTAGIEVEHARIYDKALSPTEITQTQNGQLITDGLVLHIDADYFNINTTPTTIYDLSGNGNNGTVAGGVTYSADGLEFDGVITTEVNCGDVFIVEGIDELSVSFWFMTNDNTLTCSFVGKGEYYTSSASWAIVYNTGGGGRLNFSVSDSRYRWVSFIPTNGQFYYVTCVYSKIGGYMKIYVDGVEKTGGADAGTFITIPDTANDLKIGHTTNNGTLDGTINKVCIYNRAITTEEITDLWNGTIITDGLVLRYDGLQPSTMYDIKPFTPYTPVVISAWFRLGADGVNTPSSQPIATLPYSYAYVRNTNNQIQIRYDNAGARVSLYALGNGDRDLHNMVGVIGMEGGQWYTKIYIDGVLQDSDVRSVPPSSLTQDYIEIGKRATTYFNGQIGNIKILTFTEMPSDANIIGLTSGVISAGLTQLHSYSNTIDGNQWRDDVGDNDLTIN